MRPNHSTGTHVVSRNRDDKDFCYEAAEKDAQMLVDAVTGMQMLKKKIKELYCQHCCNRGRQKCRNRIWDKNCV